MDHGTCEDRGPCQKGRPDTPGDPSPVFSANDEPGVVACASQAAMADQENTITAYTVPLRVFVLGTRLVAAVIAKSKEGQLSTISGKESKALEA